MAENQTTVNLTPVERLFRKCLIDCRDSMQSTSRMKDLELRFTGGWVRDKLLGVPSHDIDVALSTMTGWQFGQALQTYMRDNGSRYEAEAQAQGIKFDIKNLHKIAANPEKSKHLETITTRIGGIDVDFVNLRKEVYDENSRNPQMEFGTPEEDALRRDATVNALFYNLDTETVEDFTRKGLDDMQAGIIRTPLAPYQTFKDDPLRVLRLIRFASRLGYQIEEQALESMADPTIHQALRLKISRERVGVEIEKIANGPDPYRGLTLIHDLGLYSIVFADPDLADLPVNAHDSAMAYRNLRRLTGQHVDLEMSFQVSQNKGLDWILATYVPWRDGEAEALSSARAGIKASNAITKVLGDAIRHRARFAQAAQQACQGQLSRAEAGLLLRSAGSSWRSHCLYSFLCDSISRQAEEVVQEYRAFFKFIQQQELENADQLKPIVNGNDVKKALGVSKAGSWLKDALEMVVEWQYANPQGTADQAREMLQNRKHDLNLG